MNNKLYEIALKLERLRGENLAEIKTGIREAVDEIHEFG